MLSVLLYFAICMIATTVGAISGIGGGVIIKPVFDAFSGFSVATISFLSGCTVLAMSIVSLLKSKGGDVKVEPKRGTLLAVGAAFGGVVGKMAFEAVKAASGDDGLIGTIQSVIMILLTAGVFLYVLYKEKIHTRNVQNMISCLAIGLVLGLLSAFLGIGGGPINLAVLYYFFSMDTKTAAINSIYIIFFSQATSLISSFAQNNVPPFNWRTMAAMLAGGILGGFIGRAFNKKMCTRAVDRLFHVLLVVIIFISCYNLYRYIRL